jgi:hypothetical protein
MLGREKARREGYRQALDDLKAELFAEVDRRATARNPFTLESLSETVVLTINRLHRSVL